LASFGSNKTSSVIASLKLLCELGESIIITEFDENQDELRIPISANELAKYAKQAGFTEVVCEPNPTRALELLTKDKKSIGLVTGSFYLLHRLRKVIFSEN
jgi:folylpolyglutamate synthase/dihydropteroate synthase